MHTSWFGLGKQFKQTIPISWHRTNTCFRAEGLQVYTWQGTVHNVNKKVTGKTHTMPCHLLKKVRCCCCCCCCAAAALLPLAGLLEGQSLEQLAAADEPRLFLVNYWAVSSFFDELQKANAGSDRVMHAGRCVLFR